MTKEGFYSDPVAGFHASYAQLERDVRACALPPETFQPTSCYELFVNLLAAIRHDRSLALLREKPLREELGIDGDPDSIQDSRGLNSLNPVEPVDAAVERQLSWADTVRNSNARIGIYTSGTAGRAKLVWHKLGTLTRAVQTGPRYSQNVWGFCYHPAHFAGLQVFFQALMNGNQLVRLFGLSPQQIHSAIGAHSITHISGTPTFLRLLCDNTQVHAGVQRITVGGESLTPSLESDLSKTFPNAKLSNIYASTEAGSLFFGHNDRFVVPAEFSDKVRIEDGQLLVHRSLLADSLVECVALANEPSSETDRSHWIGQFYATGDQVEVLQTDPLSFRILGRSGELINVGGYKVNPTEIEDLLNEFPEVTASRVYAVPNSVTGQLVACELQTKDDSILTVADVRQRLADRLTAYQLPRIVDCVDRLATTETGKLRRRSN